MGDKHQKFAHVLAQVTLLAAIMFPLISIVTWVFWNQFAPIVSDDLENVFDLDSLTTGERLIGFSISIIGAIIQSYGLLGLRQTFRQAAAGNTMSGKAIHGFRCFTWVTLVMVFIGMAQRTGFILLFSLSDPAHKGRLDIQIGSVELKGLFVGLLLVFVAYVFAEGKRSKDENETFL